MGCLHSRENRINQVFPISHKNTSSVKKQEKPSASIEKSPNRVNSNKRVYIHNDAVLLYNNTINNYDLYTPPLGSGATRYNNVLIIPALYFCVPILQQIKNMQ